MGTHTLLTGWTASGETRLDHLELFPSFHKQPLLLQLTLLISCAHVLQVFVGNIDNDSTRTNLFDPPIVAQYIRIIPVVCRRACTLRMELVGCELNGKCTKMCRMISIYTWSLETGQEDERWMKKELMCRHVCMCAVHRL